MSDETNYKEIAMLNRAHMAEVWQRAGEDPESLSEDERVLADQMKMHEEYHRLWETIEDVGDHLYDPQKEANPFLHITIHVALENQLRSNDPPDTKRTFERLLKRGVDPHEARHAIMRVLIQEIWSVLSKQEHFDMERYRGALEKL